MYKFYINRLTMRQYGAKGYLKGILKLQSDETYTLVTDKGSYRAWLDRDFAEYLDLTDIDISTERTFIVVPITKEKGYANRSLGQVSYPPYLAFKIIGVDPKVKVDLDIFDIVGSCIYQANPVISNSKLKYDPYVLISLAPYFEYKRREYTGSYKPPTIKLIGELPKDNSEGKPDAVKSNFEIKATYDGSRLIILKDNMGNYLARRLRKID